MNLEDRNKEIDYYIDNYPDNAPVLKRIKDKINQVEKQLKEQYSLVFMAEKGAGKSQDYRAVQLQHPRTFRRTYPAGRASCRASGYRPRAAFRHQHRRIFPGHRPQAQYRGVCQLHRP